jgi:Protein of unknown function (DUF3562)
LTRAHGAVNFALPVAAPDETFEKRMRQAESEITREFHLLDPELVQQEFARVTDDLLRNAKVTDFVPVLAHRHVRENLKERSAPAAVTTTAGS